MSFDFDIIVIGAGSAGLVVASGAASLGARVALIESELMGGDCLNYGCVPSKSFLKGAHLAKEIQSAANYGLEIGEMGVNTAALMKRVHSVIEEIRPHDSKERYEGLGVTVLNGHGRLVDKNTVAISDHKGSNKRITAKKIVIATGSRAVVPNIPGLDTVEFLTNKSVFELKETPKHLIVLGGGPIGLELGQGFRHLGSEVTIIDRGEGLFSKDEPEVGPLMRRVLEDEGVNLMLGAKIIRISREEQSTGNTILVEIERSGVNYTITGDQLLVSLGRTPNTENMGLKELGINLTDYGYIVTNEKLQTSLSNVYACGDVCGPYQFTHTAGYQGSIVIRNAIFGLGAKQNYDGIAWTTYTKPEVAHVGLLQQQAEKNRDFKKAIFVLLKDNDRAKAESDKDGFLKLIISKKGRIIGATLVGDKAGEMIPVATLAIKQRLRVSAFMGLIISYPTEAEIFKSAALIDLKNSVKPWQSKLIKKLFFS